MTGNLTMSELDEERLGKKTGNIVIGEDLSLLSVEELEERIAECENEIERVRSELTAKKSSISAANAIFKQ